MADDIVTRLRDEAQRPAIREVCSEAADEIKRLRALITEWSDALYDIGGELADPERYRLAFSRYNLAADALTQEARRG